MKTSLKIFCIFTFICLFNIACSHVQKPVSFSNNSITKKPSIPLAKRILFLGDSITFQGGMIVNTDLWLKQLYPAQSFDIINVGLPSETITGLSEIGHANNAFPRPYLHDRLISILDKTKPDLIIAMYGINCGIYQPFNPQNNVLYQQGYLALHQEINKRNIPAVYITPPMYDHKKGNITALDYNDKVLRSFSEWLLKKQNDNWQVIDLYNVMNKEIIIKRKSNPSYYYQHDGIHMADDGYWLLSNLIMSYFEGEKLAKMSQSHPEVIDALSLASQLSEYPKELLTLTIEKMQLTRNAWLTYTGHNRPNLPIGLPMTEYQIEKRKLENKIDKLINKQ